ncbi:sugar phosphate isomerase/epimerase and 4-hydroxyphenylpyruvate domain-containing protein [Kineococcus rubinsiae]|uniref:sugar phosphate isomerase/epimerase and 4-hydroxyphenylpyruvate domain-containing protein n=1 Tax=Kineococcus rubinsiae TaxID=2609562 RepID=UPI001AD91273|nr:sugar phosphate isomerase/epimerase and 4-hydroxyphenylpyruvate domain-containing protein [Kineococcus rubinsiae]
MRTSIATVCLSGPLPEKLAAAAAAGFDAVEVFEPDLLSCALTPAEVRRRAADLGLAVSLFQPFRDPDHVDPAEVARVHHRLHRKCEVARELGTDLLLVCSSVHPGAVRDDDRLAAQLHDLGAVAAEHGVRLAYEALAWGSHVDDYRHSLRIARAADHPAVGVCLDSFHVLSRGDDTGGLADVRPGELFFLQLSDAPRMSMDVLPWSRHHRCFPGQGAFDLEGFLADVLAAGYTGPLSLEVFNDVFRQSDPRGTAVDAMRSLRQLADRVAARPGCAPAPSEALAVSAVALPVLPVAPAPASWAFAEVATSPQHAGDVTTLLGQLGLRRTGSHRSGPVELWSAGGVRVVVNTRTPDVRARISSLGVETADPASLGARARQLLAPVVTRAVGPGEVDIPSLAAPDATWVQFCRTDGGADDSWLADFVPDALADGAAPENGAVPEDGDATGSAGELTHVDHVALPQRFGEFDTAALFFQSVLDLLPSEVTVVPGPQGLVRSRALRSRTAGIRLVLNVVPSATLLAGRATGAGHVAFACSDVFAAAAAFTARGGRVLAIPGNYYDDLEARFQLDPDLLRRLRSAHVLYDRDADGEFLHFYTAALSRELFVEVVQRVGGYDGYGAADAAVRLAAQQA